MNILVGIDAGMHVGWHGLDAHTGALVPGDGPSGVATFGVDFEQGYTLVWEWPTDIIPSASGLEQRHSRNDRAKEYFSGNVLLTGDRMNSVRNTLARHAASGSVFLLGMPHEALPIREDSTGTSAPVPRTDMSDWLNPGQRVIVLRNRQFIDAVVQGDTANTIILDRAPGAVGKRGGLIMPVRPVLLEPKQDFARFRTAAERWTLNARAVSFHFARSLPSVALGPLTVSDGLENAVVTARHYGQNTTVFALDNGAGYAAAGEVREGTIGGEPLVIFGYQAGVTTIGDFVTRMASSSYAVLSGATDLAATLQAGDDGGGGILSGGSTEDPIGSGVALTEYAGRPVWDRPLVNRGTITDVLDAKTRILDYGGVPYAVGQAEASDSIRAVAHTGRGLEAWQWLKLFITTVRGPQRAWWLSTWRDDLTIVGHADEYITVSGDVSTWYPSKREHIHVREADGSNVYCKINEVVNNGDGTWELHTDAPPFVDPQHVSWLELCRFDDERFTFTFGAGAKFALATTARTVQQ